MRKLFVILLMLAATTAIAQVRCTIDGAEIDMSKRIVSSKSLKTITVEKGDSREIIMESNCKIKFIPLMDILKKNSVFKNMDNKVLLVDGIFVTDPGDVLIDSKFNDFEIVNKTVLANSAILQKEFSGNMLIIVRLKD